jgi:hypothetical protein
MIVFIIEAKHTEKITQVLNTHLNELSQEQIVHTKMYVKTKNFSGSLLICLILTISTSSLTVPNTMLQVNFAD